MAVEPTPALARMIEGRDVPALQETLKRGAPPAAASLIESLPVEPQVIAFRVRPRQSTVSALEP
jgi:hypothetical protein